GAGRDPGAGSRRRGHRRRRRVARPRWRQRLRVERRDPGAAGGRAQPRPQRRRALTMRRRGFIKAGGLLALLGALPQAFARAVGYPRALQGPMVGAPGPNHFTVWTRASGLFDVTLEYS